MHLRRHVFVSMACFGFAGLSAVAAGCGSDDVSGPPSTTADAAVPSEAGDGGPAPVSDAGAPDVSPNVDAGSDADAGPVGPLFGGLFNGPVHAVVHSGNAWWVGGAFTAVHAYPAPRLLSTDLSGNVRASCDLSSGFDGSVNAVLQVGNAVYAAGNFRAYKGRIAPSLVKLDAQTCARDETFSAASDQGGFAPGGYVYALASNGSALYVGGSLSTYRGVANASNAIAKLDLATGNIDTTFNPPGANANGFAGTGGSPGTVFALAISGTSLYVGGGFSAYRGVPNAAYNLAKLDAVSGALDTTFSPNGASANGFNSTVYALQVAGNALYVGGEFTRYKNVAGSANRLAKLNLTSGALDASFGPNGASANGFDEEVFALAASGTSLYAGGRFHDYRGVVGAASSVAKLDLSTGALDTTFSPAGAANNGFDREVRALQLSGNALYVAGGFARYRNSVASGRGIAKLDATTGVIDLQFRPADRTATGLNSSARSLHIVGNNLWAGGEFETYSGFSANRLAKLDDTTLALDTVVSPPGAAANGFDDAVNALAVVNSTVYVGGEFGAYRGAIGAAKSLAKIDAANGALDTAFSPPAANGTQGRVYALAASATSLYLGGQFIDYRGVTYAANNLAKLDLGTGALDTAFNPPGATANGFDTEVRALAVDGAALYVGGEFTNYRGLANAANCLAKLNAITGALDTTFSPPGATANGFDRTVHVLLPVGNGLYVGGEFDSYRGVASSANHLARLDKVSGALDTTFTRGGDNGFAGDVRALVTVGGALYVGGQFTEYGSTLFGANYLAKLDPTTGIADPVFGPPGRDANGFDSYVYALAEHGGVLVAGGEFVRYRGSNQVAGLARFDAKTSSLLK
jgi:trimeric autotransporter adhesin